MNHKERAGALRQLHARMDACRLCLQAGFEIYPRAIYSGGYKASVMIIGQAPGVTEKQAGRPFNAGSGTRLFQWLEKAGFEEAAFRSTQYMTAVTKCYPGKSKSGGDRVPSKAERALCRPYLDQEIELIDPRLILPVGRLAIGLFCGDAPLTQVVGRELRIDGRWIIPLPHPSGASRWHQLPENRRKIEQAIRKIRARRLAIGL